LAQLFFEGARGVDRLVEREDAVEHPLLPVAQVRWFAAKHDHRLEPACQRQIAGASRLIPGVTTDRVERLADGLDDMKRVQTDLGVSGSALLPAG